MTRTDSYVAAASCIGMVAGIYWLTVSGYLKPNQTPEYHWTEVAPPVTGQRCFTWKGDTYKSPVCFPVSSVPVSISQTTIKAE